MRRIVAFVPFLLLAAPLAAHAAGIPFFGPIIPDLSCGTNTTYQVSPLAWGALIIIVNNLIAFIITMGIVFFAPLMIAYAGFLYLTSGSSPGNRSKANSILTNTIIGIVVALASWLIVDMVMSVFYNGKYGDWYSIVNGGQGDPCLSIAGTLHQASLGNGSFGIVTGVGADGQLFTTGTGSCDPNALQSAVPGMSTVEANTLACIAKPESSCGAHSSGATTPSGNATSASGPFQIVFGSSNDSCHNLNVSACESLNGGQPLNCFQHFSGGKPKAGDPMAQQCINAANNLTCAAAAADCLVKADKGYSAWTADQRSSTQQSCISHFANI